MQPRAFSLVELVVVIVIIGVIAAIATPRFSQADQGACTASLQADLHALRTAIDFYTSEHHGTSPDANIVVQLTKYSDITGTLTSTTKDAASGIIFGPYLHKIPPMPIGKKSGNNTIRDTSNASDTPPQGSSQKGWWYNSATVNIRANLPDTNVDDGGAPFNTY